MRVRNGKKGLALTLYDLEATIMDVVWSKDLAHFTVNDVLTVLVQQRDIAYTTVMTTLTRLHTKGLLRRLRDGKRYLYSPRFTRVEYLQSTARSVLQGIAGSSSDGAMALLVDAVSTADEALLSELERIISRRRRDLRK